MPSGQLRDKTPLDEEPSIPAQRQHTGCRNISPAGTANRTAQLRQVNGSRRQRIGETIEMNTDSSTAGQSAHGVPRKELGAELRLLRRGAGLTQAQVAASLGVTKQAVSNWEKGLHEPHRRHTRGLADLYGVEVEEISRRYDFVADGSQGHTYRRTDVDRLKLLDTRLSLGLTQRQAGTLAELSSTVISHYETGDRIPSAGSMLKLAAAYGKPLSWFMKDN